MIALFAVLALGQTPIDFADYLYNTGDYRRAALEYERIGFTLSVDSAFSSYALLRAGEALIKSTDYHRAASVYLFGITNLAQNSEYFTYGLLRSSYYLNDFKGVDTLASMLKGTLFDQKACAYRSFSLAFAGDNKGAIRELALLPSEGPRDSALYLLDTPLKRRSPWLSAGLSTLLPGCGQAYCGRWGDAWQSFATVVLLGGAAVYYQFFSRDTSAGNTVKVVVTGSIAGLFWLGNIYGAANAALDFNEYQERKRFEQLRNLLDEFDLEPVIERP